MEPLGTEQVMKNLFLIKEAPASSLVHSATEGRSMKVPPSQQTVAYPHHIPHPLHSGTSQPLNYKHKTSRSMETTQSKACYRGMNEIKSYLLENQKGNCLQFRG